MATSSAAVNSVFNKLLGRDAGTEGQAYWSGEWEKAKAAAIAGGKSAADAEASATAVSYTHLTLPTKRIV